MRHNNISCLFEIFDTKAQLSLPKFSLTWVCNSLSTISSQSDFHQAAAQFSGSRQFVLMKAAAGGGAVAVINILLHT